MAYKVYSNIILQGSSRIIREHTYKKELNSRTLICNIYKLQ